MVEPGPRREFSGGTESGSECEGGTGDEGRALGKLEGHADISLGRSGVQDQQAE